MGVSPGTSLLVATGFSICGASAVAAMDGVTRNEEDEVVTAIVLVTLFGSLAIVVLPLLQHPLGLSDVEFGVWTGASVHDVAQTVATASVVGPAALTAVVLLAPMVAGVSIWRRRTQTFAYGARRPPDSAVRVQAATPAGSQRRQRPHPRIGEELLQRPPWPTSEPAGMLRAQRGPGVGDIRWRRAATQIGIDTGRRPEDILNGRGLLSAQRVADRPQDHVLHLCATQDALLDTEQHLNDHQRRQPPQTHLPALRDRGRGQLPAPLVGVGLGDDRGAPSHVPTILGPAPGQEAGQTTFGAAAFGSQTRQAARWPRGFPVTVRQPGPDHGNRTGPVRRLPGIAGRSHLPP
jgi:hypothetical protein